jgi:hypothetical protein
LPPGFLIGGVRRWNWDEVLHHLGTISKRKRRRGRGVYDRRKAVERGPDHGAPGQSVHPHPQTPDAGQGLGVEESN